MTEIKNLMFQPLTFHLAESGKSLHLKPRERRPISETEISPEIEAAEKRGFVSLIRSPETTANGEPASAAQAESPANDSKAAKKPTQRKKRR